MKSFRDSTTNVLKAYGFVESNAEGDLGRTEEVDFDLEPGKWQLVDDEWVAYSPPTTVPDKVTMRQARLALRATGLYSAVNTVVAEMAGEQGDYARIEWEFSSEVYRHRPLVLAMIATLGWTGEQVDQLFITAAGL